MKFLQLIVGMFLLTMTPALAQESVKFCAGSEAGNYTFAANEIVKRMPEAMRAKTEIVITKGSRDNLDRMAKGECDIAFTQGDVATMYAIDNPAARNSIKPFKKVYSEYVHLICSTASGWTSIDDLENARIIVGQKGTGNAETWRSFFQANDAYEKFQRLPDDVGITSLSTVKDNANTCMLWVSGLNSANMKSANAMSIRTKDGKPALRIINIEDEAITRLLDLDGMPMYETAIVKPVKADPSKNTAGLYDNLIDTGFWSTKVNLPTVPAWIYINAKLDKDAAFKDAVTAATEDAMPTIWATVNPQ